MEPDDKCLFAFSHITDVLNIKCCYDCAAEHHPIFQDRLIKLRKVAVFDFFQVGKDRKNIFSKPQPPFVG